jgi:flagellar hook protein FlgE
MISGIPSGLSAVQAFGNKLDATANNIANANSARFKKSRVEFQESAPAGLGVTAVVEQVDTPGVQILQETPQGPQLVEQSNVDLGEEAVNLILAERGIELNAHVISAHDAALGSLVNLLV